jgi:plasmid stabilization system protein ParE
MGNRPVEFQEEATAEYEAAFDWYFERSRIAAQKFSAELSQAVAIISESPQRWPTNLHNTRRFFLRHFPFAVVYRELPSTIK